MIGIDLNEQQALDADPQVLQKVNFTRHFAWLKGATMFFIIEESKETILDFS